MTTTATKQPQEGQQPQQSDEEKQRDPTKHNKQALHPFANLPKSWSSMIPNIKYHGQQQNISKKQIAMERWSANKWLNETRTFASEVGPDHKHGTSTLKLPEIIVYKYKSCGR